MTFLSELFQNFSFGLSADRSYILDEDEIPETVRMFG